MSLETKSSDYLASPERAIALLNKVMSGGGDLAAIEQALCIVVRALERAGIQGSGVTSLPSERTQHHRTGSPRSNQPPSLE
jgi:hypothetical protein